MKNKLPERKPLRLKRFDYNNVGSYFITVCTANKEKFLSEVVTTDGEARIRLSPKGMIAEEIIKNIPSHLDVEIDRYVIMPNHIHFIVIVNPSQCASARSAVSKTVGFIKMNSSKEIRKRFGQENVWQRGFYDHIIRGEKDYDKICEYIYTNPFRWKYDDLYSE